MENIIDDFLFFAFCVLSIIILPAAIIIFAPDSGELAAGGAFFEIHKFATGHISQFFSMVAAWVFLVIFLLFNPYPNR